MFSNIDAARNAPLRATRMKQIESDRASRKVEVATEEEYLARKGFVFMGSDDPGLHRSSNRISDKKRKRQAAVQAKKTAEFNEQRAKLRREYRDKLARGEIRSPSREETLRRIAEGHSDNESVRAARRLLEKRAARLREQNG